MVEQVNDLDRACLVLLVLSPPIDEFTTKVVGDERRYPRMVAQLDKDAKSTGNRALALHAR